MNAKLDIIFDSELPRLIPYDLLEEFSDILDENLKNKFRANSLRQYLEGIVEMFFKDDVIVKEGLTVESWNKKPLHQHIELICKHYDANFGGIFNKLKGIGNQGSHHRTAKTVTHQEIVEGLEIVVTIVEEILIDYFGKYPFGTQLPVMTYLSALPPISRVYILKRLWENDKQNSEIIDKLSMAYLKSGNKEESTVFLDTLKSNNYITDYEHLVFIDKIEKMSKYVDKFDISQNLFDTGEIFKRLSRESSLIEQYPEFTKIFFTLLKGYDSMSKGVCFNCGEYSLYIMYDDSSYPTKFFCSSCSYKRSDINAEEYLICPECGAVSLLYDEELQGGICLWHRCVNHKDGGILIEMEFCTSCNCYKIEDNCNCNS